MSTRSFTKAERREIRRLAGIAHERELSAAAAELELAFKQWRDGTMDVFALNERIHKFHDGTSRDLYKLYVMGEAEWNVASAIARGILNESEVLPALVENMRNAIELVRGYSKDEKGITCHR